MSRHLPVLSVTALFLLITCAPIAGAQPAPRRPATFTASDVDAYQKGFAREIELIRTAQQQARSSRGPDRFGGGMQAGDSPATIAEAAKAAGMTPARYRDVRDTINDVLRVLDVQGKIPGPMSMDLSQLSPEQRKKYERDPMADLSPESASALRSRLDKLAPLWADYINMTAVAG